MVVLSRAKMFGSPLRHLNIIGRKTAEYYRISDIERLDFYKPGGYHPVTIGNLLHNRYRVLDKLGHGGYSTIWLAWDTQSDQHVAVKIKIASSPYSGREIRTLQTFSNSKLAYTNATKAARTEAFGPSECVQSIFDNFKIQGPNGNHTAFTTAPTQGSLREASYSRLFPVRVARALAAKLSVAISFIHSQGFVHGGQLAIPKSMILEQK